MISISRMTTGVLVVLASFTAAPEPAAAQVGGGSCQRILDLDPNTFEPSQVQCFVDGLVFLGSGQQDFFNISVTATVFETENSDFDLYDVQLNLQASGGFPDGFVFGRAEIRDGGGNLCEVEISSSFAQANCEDMFSFDSGFLMFAEAFSGSIPG
jgi:hypothetical protein